jgi:hypothetical protein
MKANTKLKIAVNRTGGLPFAIDRNIPLQSRKKPNPYSDLFKAMKPGDSFLIGTKEAVIKTVHYQAGRWGKENDATFAFRTTDAGKRVWRVK